MGVGGCNVEAYPFVLTFWCKKVLYMMMMCIEDGEKSRGRGM
jgi:hypothetical protein